MDLESSKGISVAIMQPYLFPYLGYFQLIAAVDEFVIYDDVQYLKGGWVNRNRVMSNGSALMFTLPVIKSGALEDINEKRINEFEWKKKKNKVVTSIRQEYSRCAYFGEAFPVIESALNFKTDSLACFVVNSLRLLCDYMEIDTNIKLSSRDFPKVDSVGGVDRVVNICKSLKASKYVNAVGGKSLYSKEYFRGNDLNLYFLEMSQFEYVQKSTAFIPNLSVVDLMMNHSVVEIKAMLNFYKLV